MKLDDWQKEVLETSGDLHIRAGRQVGKSTIVSQKAVQEAVGFRPTKKKKELVIMVIAFTERQAYLLFEKILATMERKYPQKIMRGTNRPTKHALKLTNGARILCLPTGMTGFGIMGYSIDLLIVDEAAFVPDQVYRSVIPSLAVTRGTIWLLSTPCGSSGYFYDTWTDKKFTHFHISSEDCPRRDQDFLDREKERLSAAQYAQWYLGEFVSDFNRVFSDELISKICVLKRPDVLNIEGSRYYMGCDLARMGGDQITFQIIQKIDKETFVQVESIVKSKRLTTQTEDDILELHRQYNFKGVGLDAGAGTLGVSIADHLLRESAISSRIISLNNRAIALDRDGTKSQRLLKEDMYFNLLALMERKRIKLLNDDEIMASLRSCLYEYTVQDGQQHRLRIFGNYTHIAEGLIRAAWLCTEDHSLDLWAR